MLLVLYISIRIEQGKRPFYPERRGKVIETRLRLTA